MTYGGLPAVNEPGNGISPPVRVKTNLTYDLKTYIPLTFNTGKMLSGAQPSLTLSYNGAYFYYRSLGAYKPGIIYTQPRLYLYTYLRTAPRDIQPRLGLTFDGFVESTPFENEQLGNLSVYRTTVYLPGFLRHDGLKLTAEIQRQNARRYLFYSSVHFPRGYTDMNALDMDRLSADYVLPLVYPDLDLKGLFFLKRIRAGLFADLMKGSSIYRHRNGNTEVFDATYRSYGVELYLDYHVLRLLFPLESGVRISYLQNENRFTVEGLFSVNLGFF